jgi:ABC-2 type transport system ATP-binding protein
MNPTELAINLSNVEKRYRGKVHALRGIDMQVRRGEVFGLLGPNGAGKSTLVKIMMTVVRPTRAAGTILGKPIGHKPTLDRVGYLPENHRFPRYLTGRQTLEFFAALSNVQKERAKKRAAELLDLTGMTTWADRKVSTYSKGMMQRIGLAQAMVNDPDLIVLDEPTDGVDPVGRREIRDVLLALKQKGVTVFINSHLLSELEMICDRVAILVGGRVAQQGTMDELALGQGRYEIQLASANGTLASLVANALEQFMAFEKSPPLDGGLRGTLSSGHTIEFSEETLRVSTVEALDIQPVLDRLRGAGLTIRRVQPVRPTLEEMFIAAVRTHAEHSGAGAALPNSTHRSSPHSAPSSPPPLPTATK